MGLAGPALLLGTTGERFGSQIEGIWAVAACRIGESLCCPGRHLFVPQGFNRV